MKVRRISIAKKMLFLISGLCILCSVGVGFVAYKNESSNLLSLAKANVSALSKTAAGYVNGDSFSQITQGMENSTQYQDIYNQLSVMRDYANVEYVYSVKRADSGETVFVVDTDPNEPAGLFETYESDINFDEVMNGSTVVLETKDKWGSHLSSYSPVISSNDEVVGAVGVDVSASWITSQLNSIRNVLLILSASFIFAGILLAFFICRRMEHNLVKLNNKILDINGGDGDLTKRIEMFGGDELEVIANNFNQFIDTIRKLVRNSSQTSEEMYSSGTSMAGTIDSNVENIVVINDRITELSSDMEECNASTEGILSDLGMIADKMNQLDIMTTQIREYTSSAKDEAANEIDQVTGSRDKAKDQIGDLEKRLSSAGEDAKKIQLIQSMCERIRSIAQQTRTLSLNARIEAARAGVAGKGFVVVASEVGKLSEEIEKTVVEMNSTSTEVIAAVDNLMAQTTQISDFIHADVMVDYDNLVSIAEHYVTCSNDINDRMNFLEESTADVNQNLHTVKDRLLEIGNAVTSSTESIVDINTLTRNINNSFQSLNCMAEENKERATNLKGELDIFCC